MATLHREEVLKLAETLDSGPKERVQEVINFCKMVENYKHVQAASHAGVLELVEDGAIATKEIQVSGSLIVGGNEPSAFIALAPVSCRDLFVHAGCTAIFTQGLEVMRLAFVSRPDCGAEVFGKFQANYVVSGQGKRLLYLGFLQSLEVTLQDIFLRQS